MFSYPKAHSEYEAARLASQDVENWNDGERNALALIADLGTWKYQLQEIISSDKTSKEIDTDMEKHEQSRPDVVGPSSSPFGASFVVHPGKVNHLTFYIHPATSGFNIGVKNSDLGKS